MMEQNKLYSNLKSGNVFIIGPCVMESLDNMDLIASRLSELSKKLKILIVFKASFDKANRTSIESYRGPGIERGLEWLKIIKNKYNLPVSTDIHESWQAELCANIVDIIQIPAFLCRQTDLILAAANTGMIVNIKKAQFLTAHDMKFPLTKALSTGNQKICLTERGTMMGPNNLIVDFRNITELLKFNCPVVMDATHSVQTPGGSTTGGKRDYILPYALTAKVFGARNFFFETHPNPDLALSDGPNMIPLDQLENLLDKLINLNV